MSFRAKTREWKRRLVHLLVVVLLLNNVYCLPVMAQTDGQGILPAGDVLESVSGGDEVVIDVPEEQTEGEDVQADLSEGAVLESLPGESVPVEDTLDSGLMYLQPGVEGQAADGDAPWGDSAIELKVGETIYGLAGTDTYAESDYIGGYWLKMDLTDTGVYHLERTTSGFIRLFDPLGCEHDYTVAGSDNISIIVGENDEYIWGKGTYYCYVKGYEDFDVSLTKVPVIKEMEAEVVCDRFYYETLYPNTSPYIEATLKLTLEDGTEVVTDSGFEYDYMISSGMCDTQGNYVNLDENGKYPVGEYVYRFYQSDFYGEVGDIYCDVPITIVSIDDDAKELTVGGSVTGLAGKSSDGYNDYVGGHWLKFEATEPGNYTLTKSVIGNVIMLWPDGSISYMEENLTDEIHIGETGTFYLYVKSNDVFDVTLTRNPMVVDIEMNVRRDTFYYEWENWSTFWIYDSGRLIFEDGTELSISNWDENWQKYGIYSGIYDESGTYVQPDEWGKYPVGDYICKVEVSVGEASFEVPVKVVSVDDVSTEISLGENITGLTGTDTYENHNFVGGHWFKLEIENPGLYNLTKSAEGTIVVVKPDYNQHNWASTFTHMVMRATEAGTYYFYVKGNETFELSIVSVEDVATTIRTNEAISWFAGVEDYNNPWTKGGHWLKLEVDEPGYYTLSKSAPGIMEVSYFDGMAEFLGEGMEGHLLIQEDTPYCYVKGSEDFEVTLTKQPEVVEIRPVINRDKSYYEVEYMGYYTAISQLELVLDDGTVVTCQPYDSVWHKYSMYESVLDADGNFAQYDENGKYPVGNYSIVIAISNNTNVNAQIPIEVVSLDGVAMELKPGQTISDLSPCDNYTSDEYEGGHWFKAEVEEGLHYVICKSASGLLEYYSSWGNGYSNDTESWELTPYETGIYYFYAKGDEAFEISLYAIEDTAKEIKVGETISDLAGCTNYLNYEDIGGHWIKANLEKEGAYVITKTARGNVEGRDPNWGYNSWWNSTSIKVEVTEPGTYYFYLKGSEAFDVTLLSIDDMAIEIEVGDTITGLSPSVDADDMDNRYNGHIFKVEIEEPGRYEAAKSTNGMTYIEGMGNVSGAGWSSIWAIDVTQPGTYYIYVKGYETFDFTFVKTPQVLEMRAYVKRDILYYEFDYVEISNLISSLELTLDNGSVVTCIPGDEIWNKYDIYCHLWKADGNIPESDENYKYPVGEYKFILDPIGSAATCDVFFSVVSIKDENVVIPQLLSEPMDLTEVLKTQVYKMDVTKTGSYELKVNGNLQDYCYMYVYDENGNWVVGRGFTSMYQNVLGTLNPGSYYVQFSSYNDVPDDVTIQLARVPELDNLEYNGSDIVWKYGEWGYRLENVVSGNYVSTATLSSNFALSGNSFLNVTMPIKLEGTLTDGSNIEIPFNQYMQVWRNYKLDYKICKADGTTAYTDRNGYLANGNYKIVVTSGYGYARVEIPFKVAGGPVVPSSWTYSGAAQEMKYGTWGYKISQSMSGNRADVPMRPNADLNGMVSGNNVLALDFKVTAKSDDGQTDTVSYGSKAWNLYRIKTYFYDAEGNSVRTDQNGYIPEGSYVMKCVAYNGTEFEIPLKVYKDAGDIAEEQLSTAVDEMLTEAEKLTDENLAEATEEEKKTVVEEVLQKVEEIYENQEIAEIGAADADKAIELAEKLEEVEKQIEELLNTSVTVVPQDTEAVEIEVQVKNALLSVPAGENAQIKVTTAEVPENIPVEKENASAIQLELVAESEEKMQLNAPVIVTVKIPEGIDTNEEIWVYHFADLQEKAKEIIKAKLNGDGTLSFVTGSFSTFVIANAAKGASVSGKVVSFGDEAEEVTIKVLNGDKMVVAETVSAADTGAYQFEQLEAGEYTLVFSKSNHVDREYSITVAEENVVLDAEIYLLGDVDGNGKVNARDKKTIYNHIAGESELTGYEFQVGDTDGNGKINARDKKMIYNHIAGEDLLW